MAYERKYQEFVEGERAQPCLPKKPLVDSITNQFYDKNIESIVEQEEKQYSIKMMNIARDKQCELEGSFSFLEGVDSYSKIRPQKQRQQQAYEFHEPHVRDEAYVEPKRATKAIPQTQSEGLKSTFSNFTDPNLPLIDKKSNQAYTDRKKIYPSKYDDVARFPLGYVGVE